MLAHNLNHILSNTIKLQQHQDVSETLLVSPHSSHDTHTLLIASTLFTWYPHSSYGIHTLLTTPTLLSWYPHSSHGIHTLLMIPTLFLRHPHSSHSIHTLLTASTLFSPAPSLLLQHSLITVHTVRQPHPFQRNSNCIPIPDNHTHCATPTL